MSRREIQSLAELKIFDEQTSVPTEQECLDESVTYFRAARENMRSMVDKLIQFKGSIEDYEALRHQYDRMVDHLILTAHMPGARQDQYQEIIDRAEEIL